MKGILTGCADHNLCNKCLINENLKKKKRKENQNRQGRSQQDSEPAI